MIVIENGLVLEPTGSTREADVAIKGEFITATERPGSFRNSSEVKTRIDARGGLVLPGLVDLHVHLREPGFEWKETIVSGAQAAALGGYTTICCMPNTKPVNDHAEITRFIRERAFGAPARVLPIGSVSQGLKGEQMSPLSELREAGCVAFSDDGEPVWHSGLMRRALEWASMLDVPICCHEEDKHLSAGGCMNESGLSTRLGLKGMSKTAEDVMVARDIELARLTGAQVHFCHVSTARSAELIRRAKNDGIRVTAETTPHHLALTEDRIGEYDTSAKMSPPLREESERLALLAAINDGTIDAIASDHAPHEMDSKRVEFAKATFGIIGLQTSLSIILGLIKKGELKEAPALRALSAGPARALKLAGGRIERGAVADIIVVDRKANWNLDPAIVRSLSKNSPWLGQPMLGQVTDSVLNGRVIVRSGALETESSIRNAA